jgi:hypothetical protein
MARQMTNELTFKTNSIFKSVTYDPDAESWYIVFADRVAFNVSAFWRLLGDKQIKLVSLDHGHQFGLPEPVDLSQLLTDALTGKALLEIKVKQNTADLLLTLTDNLEIEIFISSSGYETYNFSIDRKNYIGLGSGDIAVFDDK